MIAVLSDYCDGTSDYCDDYANYVEICEDYLNDYPDCADIVSFSHCYDFRFWRDYFIELEKVIISRIKQYFFIIILKRVGRGCENIGIYNFKKV